MRAMFGAMAFLGLGFLAACDGGTTKTGDDDDDDTTAPGDDDDDTAPGDDDDDDDTTGVELLTCDDPFAACGGDATGTWQVSGVCQLDFSDFDCDGLVVTIDADRSSGTVELGSDGTYSRVYNVDVDISATVPKACVDPAPCTLVPAASGGSLTACTDDGDNCACTGTVAYTDDENGTWTSAGTQLTFDGGGTVLDYCVAGNSAITQDADGVIVSWQK
jgi:hypothetical protein